MKKKIKLIIGLLIIIIVVIGATIFYYNNELSAVSKETNVISFEIKSGDSNNAILEQLEKEGIIKNDFVAKIYLKFSRSANFKAGVYEVDASNSTQTIIAYLSNAANTIKDDVTITFIEGDWAKEMAKKIADVTNLEAEEILAYWNDETVVRALMSDYPFLTEELFDQDVRILLEGYLAPNTYSFHRTTTLDAVTRRLLDETMVLYTTYESEIAESDFSIHEIFALASIVQFEARTVEDMKMISAVLQNRLAIQMPLQVSASVCYAIDLEEGDDWRKCETNPEFESPYNTYKYGGLPPGAIMSFGKDAFDSVLNPTTNNYYYFVADVYGDGSVHYAETYAEHLKNVERFGL